MDTRSATGTRAAAGVPFARPLAETKGKGRYALVLLVACAVAFFGVVLMLVLRDRSLIWETDGRLLYLPFMIAEGEWLRGIVSSLLAGSPSVPVYSFDLGFGADWLVTASGNSNEPLNLLAALCPREFSEYFYAFLVFLRFYLATLTFSLYCFSRGKGKGASLVGALCYGLCGYVVLWGVLRHPNFIDFAVLLPLVFMGADKLFARKNPLLFVLAMAGIFVYSIYFAYMTCIFLLFYCLITYFAYPRARSVGDFLLLAGKFALGLVVAFALVGFSTVPMFLTLTSMGRVGIVRDIAFFQTPDFYASFAAVLLGDHTAQNASVLGAVSVIAMLALAVAGPAIDRCERRAWGAGVLLCLAGVMLAKVGSLMNGFGYPTDRWELILGFCAAYAVVLLVPAVTRLTMRQWGALAVLAGAVGAWALWYAVGERTLLGFAVVAMFAVVFAALAGWAAWHRRARARSGKMPWLLRPQALCVLLALAVVVNAAGQTGIFLSSQGSLYYKEFLRADHGLSTREQLDLAPALDEVDDAYRINRTDTTYGRNGSFVHGYKGFDFYSSFYNQVVDDFRQSLGLSDDVKSTMFDGTEQRAALDYVLGARYYISSSEAADLVPEGYEKVADLGEAHNGLSYALYETDRALPVAFTYETAVSQSVYDDLNLVERQELMTRALVLGIDRELAAAPKIETENEVPSVAASDGAYVQDGRIVATKRDASVTLAFDGRPDCETYLCFEGFRFASLPAADADLLAGDSELAVESLPGDPGFVPGRTAWVSVTGEARDDSFEMVTSASPKYAGKEDWAVNAGYSAEPQTALTVTLSAVGVYEYDELYVATQPQQAVLDNTAQLQRENAATITFGDNAMEVHVDASDHADGEGNGENSRYVFMSVPYSAGWSATIDGQPADVLRANVGFMAVEVDDAAHDVSFSYMTPGLLPGFGCTGVALGALVVYEVWRSRRRTAAREDVSEKELVR